jgi:hypothetical protein
VKGKKVASNFRAGQVAGVKKVKLALSLRESRASYLKFFAPRAQKIEIRTVSE